MLRTDSRDCIQWSFLIIFDTWDLTQPALGKVNSLPTILFLWDHHHIIFLRVNRNPNKQMAWESAFLISQLVLHDSLLCANSPTSSSYECAYHYHSNILSYKEGYGGSLGLIKLIDKNFEGRGPREIVQLVRHWLVSELSFIPGIPFGTSSLPAVIPENRVVGMSTGSIILENATNLLKNLGIDIPYNPAILLLSIHSKGQKLFRKCISIIQESKSGNNPKCLGTNDWMKKLWCYVYSEIWLNFKKRWSYTICWYWMDLESVMLNQIY